MVIRPMSGTGPTNRRRIPPSDTESWDVSQPHRSGGEQPPLEPELGAVPQLSGLIDRPRLRLVRTTPPSSGLPLSPLRRDPEGLLDAPRGAGTRPSMTETMTAPPPQLLRTLTQRPGVATRARAKSISTVSPEVVVPAAADPAVLVHVHSDLRLSLAQLASETGTGLAARYVVTRLATGCLDLAPEPPASDENASQDVPTTFLTCRVDARSRLSLTPGLINRLAVSVGDKLLVTISPESKHLRVLNLGTLADAVEACLAAAGEEVRP